MSPESSCPKAIGPTKNGLKLPKKNFLFLKFPQAFCYSNGKEANIGENSAFT
jgi:hypothetical protein